MWPGDYAARRSLLQHVQHVQLHGYVNLTWVAVFGPKQPLAPLQESGPEVGVRGEGGCASVLTRIGPQG